MSAPTLHPALAWALVAAQVLLIGALVLLPPGELWSRDATVLVIGGGAVAFGAVLTAVGLAALGRALTPSPAPRTDGELVTTGVYARVRHPVYSGLLLAALGLVVMGASFAHVAVAVALGVLLSVKARLEERMLRSRFADYDEYAAATGRFLPRPRARR